MARAFTIPFLFEGKECTAVVTHLDGSVKIYLPDESLHNLLPGGTFTFLPEKGLQISQPALSPKERLLLSVLVSLEEQQNRSADPCRNEP